MKSRALSLLGPALLLTGCSSQAAPTAPSASATHTRQHATPVVLATAAGTMVSKPVPSRTVATKHSPAKTPVAPATLVEVGVAAGSPYLDGQAALHAGKYKLAQRDFSAAIARHDHLAAAYAGLGTADIGLHKFVAAATAFRHAVHLQPSNAGYQYDAGYAALYSFDYHAAVTYATVYIRLRPRDPKGYHLRFLAFGSLTDRGDQIRDARTVARLEPHSPVAYNDLGIALANNQQFKQSIQAFDHAIALDPKNATYYQNRGQAEYDSKQPRAALADFKRARSLTRDAGQRSRLAVVIAYIQKQLHH